MAEVSVNGIAVKNRQEIQEELISHNLSKEKAESVAKKITGFIQVYQKTHAAQNVEITIADDESNLISLNIDGAILNIGGRIVTPKKDETPKEVLVGTLEDEIAVSMEILEKGLEMRREAHEAKLPVKTKTRANDEFALTPVKQNVLTKIINKLREILSKIHFTKPQQEALIRRITSAREWGDHIDRFKEEKLEPTLEKILTKLAQGKDELAVLASKALDAVHETVQDTLDTAIEKQDEKAKKASKTLDASHRELDEMLNGLLHQKLDLEAKLSRITQKLEEAEKVELSAIKENELKVEMIKLEKELEKLEKKIQKIENSKEYKKVDGAIKGSLRSVRTAKATKEVLETVREGMDR
ncbi:MAG: hypothetical protein IJS47_05320 [Clostridia bacterium]|nr:hypothetical protein [Clostridia bacterium]